MQSAGFGLLSTVLRDAVSFSSLTESGITSKFLIKDEVTVYNFIFDFFREYGAYPSFETVKRETGQDLSEYPAEPFSYWVDKVYRRRSLRIAVTEAQKIIDTAREGEVNHSIETAHRLYLAMERLNPSALVHRIRDSVTETIATHDERQRSSERIIGIPTGFPYFDDMSGGMQLGDFIILVGRPGEGKSFVLFKMANSAYDYGRKPVVVTFEMPVKQCSRRLLGMRAQISTTQLKMGRLSYLGRRKAVAACNLLGSDSDWGLPIIEGSDRYTVEDLLTIVQDLGADSLFIDGAYFLNTQKKTTSKFEKISEVANALRSGALRLNIPIIGTYQFNKRAGKKGGGLGDIYMSDDMSQLGSMVFKLYSDVADGESAPQWGSVEYKIMELLKGREGERGKIKVKYDMLSTIIEQDEILSDYRTSFQAE